MSPSICEEQQAQDATITVCKHGHHKGASSNPGSSRDPRGDEAARCSRCGLWSTATRGSAPFRIDSSASIASCATACDNISAHNKC
jgi:hypothetical protein